MRQTGKKAVSLALALSMALGMAPAMALDGSVKAGVRGPKRSGFGEALEQYVTLGSAERVNLVQVDFDVDPKLVSMRAMEALEGFMVVDSVKWSTNPDGSAHACVTIGMAGLEGFTVEEMTDVLKIAFNDLGVEGRSGLKLTGVKTVALDEQNRAYYVDTELTEAETGAEIVWSRYDLNRDGAVDMLDVASALRYYQMTEADADWDGVEYCDVSQDGAIDMSDLTLIMAHYGAANEPEISIAVTPEDAQVSVGASQQFTAAVTGADEPVVWSVEGGNSAATVIDVNGLLTVGIDETAETLVVTAALARDELICASVSVAVEAVNYPVRVDFEAAGTVVLVDGKAYYNTDKKSFAVSEDAETFRFVDISSGAAAYTATLTDGSWTIAQETGTTVVVGYYGPSIVGSVLPTVSAGTLQNGTEYIVVTMPDA